MIPQHVIQKISELPILGVADSLKLEYDVHRHCHCPAHLDECPSLVLYPSTNTFYCFSCRRHGGVIDLAMLVLGKKFPEACQRLGQGDWYRDPQAERRVSATCPRDPFDATRYLRYFEHPFLNKKSSEFLFNERKLNPRVIEWCRLSSWRDSLQIPYFGLDGSLIGVQFRNLGSSGPRFRYPKGSRCHIYNLNILNYLSPGEELYIAEGCSDCWSLMSAGHKAIAIPSATLCNAQIIKELSIINCQLSIKWNMYPDKDTPGENLYQQLNSVLNVTRHPLPEGCKDYSDYFVKKLTC